MGMVQFFSGNSSRPDCNNKLNSNHNSASHRIRRRSSGWRHAGSRYCAQHTLPIRLSALTTYTARSQQQLQQLQQQPQIATAATAQQTQQPQQSRAWLQRAMLMERVKRKGLPPRAGS